MAVSQARLADLADVIAALATLALVASLFVPGRIDAQGFPGAAA